MAASPFIAALEKARTPEDVLAATRTALNLDGPRPTLEDLADFLGPPTDREGFADHIAHPHGPRTETAEDLAKLFPTTPFDEWQPAFWACLPTDRTRETDGREGWTVGAMVPVAPQPPNPRGFFVVMRGLDLLEVNRRWLAARKDGTKHPLGALVLAWDDRPRAFRRTHLLVTEERRPPPKKDPLVTVRAPGVLHLATLAVTEVDGEPFASNAGPELQRLRAKRTPPAQTALDLGNPFPRTLAGEATGGILVEAIAARGLAADERNPIRADMLRLGEIAYALTHAARITTAEGAALVGGKDTPANRKRFQRALGLLRWLYYENSRGIWDLVDAERGGEGVNRLGPPRWFLDRKKGNRDPSAWHLSGGLFRPARLADSARGTALGYWGAIHRTIAGLEAALARGPTAGRGKRGRIPDYLRPERKGGPGPKTFVPWWQVLRLAGEPVGPETPNRRAAGQRYRDRIRALGTAGYKCTNGRTAEAGDTVEVLEVRKGTRWRTGGLVVRATARYCAAYESGERIRIRASRLLPRP